MDSYKTVAKPIESILFKDRKSKFYAYVYPIASEDDVKFLLTHLKKIYPNANHVCYAWQLGVTNCTFRANDDGEPNNSAGMPIYGQIQAFDITNVLVAVVRIFGGTKLGVGGLIQAYKTAAKLALESAEIIEKLIEDKFQLTFEYPEMDIVMRLIKQLDITIISQTLENDCKIIISKRKSESGMVWKKFNALHKLEIKRLD